MTEMEPVAAAAPERPHAVFFRRGSFYGDFQETQPRWHLQRGPEPVKWGTYIAYCGYARSNLLGDLKVSRSKTPKRASETCAKCIAALTKEQKHEARQAAARRRA